MERLDTAVNCLRCNFRHKDNGNCTEVGGFCTAVPAAHYPLLMKRLTKKIGDAIVFPPDLIGVTLTPDNEPMHTILTQLAAYEDTGLMPEMCANYRKFEDEAISKGVPFRRIVELMDAEKDGRVVVLPCKVGDTVCYCNGKYIVDYEVIDFSVDDTGAWLMHVEHRADGNDATYGYYLDTDKIGKTVFFTREEAEEALKENRDG